MGLFVLLVGVDGIASKSVAFKVFDEIPLTTLLFFFLELIL